MIRHGRRKETNLVASSAESGIAPLLPSEPAARGAGLIVLVLGYFLLAQGSITAAPMLLVLGYVVLIPLALIL